MVDYRELIKKFESKADEALKNYKEQKRELFKIVRADFLAGGIIAGSFFVVITSIMNYFSTPFPWDLLTGIGGCILGIIILVFPILGSKASVKLSNELFLDGCRDGHYGILLNAMKLSSEAEKNIEFKDETGFQNYIKVKTECYKGLWEGTTDLINALKNHKRIANLTPEVYDRIFSTISRFTNQFITIEDNSFKFNLKLKKI